MRIYPETIALFYVLHLFFIEYDLTDALAAS